MNSPRPAPTRLAILVSHPIPYFCSQYRAWSALEQLELKVFFASNAGLRAYHDPGFDRELVWERLDMDFPHCFLDGSESGQAASDSRPLVLSETLADFDPDLLLVYGYSQKLPRQGIDWGSSHGVPVIMISDSERRSARPLWKRVVKKLVLPGLYRRVSYFLTVGDANEDYYAHYGVGRDRMVRSFFPIERGPLETALDQASIQREAIRQRWQIPVQHTVVLCVGKLVSHKRQRDLIEFSNRIVRTRDDITVVLVGTGPDEAELRRLCQKEGSGGVIFAGFAQPDEVASYYVASDLYVHCSSREPHALAISEALFCGLPVVVSDRCGSHGETDDVQPGKNGLVFPCGDVARLQEQVLTLADDPVRRAAMGAMSRKIALQHQERAYSAAILELVDRHTAGR